MAVSMVAVAMVQLDVMVAVDDDGDAPKDTAHARTVDVVGCCAHTVDVVGCQYTFICVLVRVVAATASAMMQPSLQ